MISALTRARAYGGLVALATFALGVAAGVWYAGRTPPGVNITITATDRMPRELERLGLTDAERVPIQEALRRGRDRVLRANGDMAARVQVAVDSTDQEIRALLSPEKRASFDSARRVNGPALRRRELIIKH
ncbi:MAG: hypothetical protein M3Y30_03185 [Gemmatimonadota bacterium]|nr:hypothetical protein [Gemmatimonadota bacterium]